MRSIQRKNKFLIHKAKNKTLLDSIIHLLSQLFNTYRRKLRLLDFELSRKTNSTHEVKIKFRPIIKHIFRVNIQLKTYKKISEKPSDSFRMYFSCRNVINCTITLTCIRWEECMCKM